MGHWFNVVETLNGAKHAEIVNWLKTVHRLGHGYANAIVAHVKSASKG